MNKLAIVCGSLGKGGAERITIYLAKYMQNRGIKTFIVTGGKREIEYECPENIERFILDEIDGGGKVARKGLLLLRYQIDRLKKFLVKQEIDTVLVMDTPVCIYAIPACFRLKVKVIISERNDPAHFAGKKITQIVSRILMKKANGFVFQTLEAQKYFGAAVLGKSVVIPNPIFTEKMPKAPFGGKREKKIVSVGRLNKQKNQRLLIDAFYFILKDYPDYKLYIWGEGAERKNLEDYIRKIGIEESIFLPGVTENVYEEIYNASIFVLSSDFEGMPNALIEAMALGVPCISTDCPCGGPGELIEDGKNGILIPVNKRDTLINSIENLLQDKEKAMRIGNEAFQIREKLCYEIICNKWYDFLSE